MRKTIVLGIGLFICAQLYSQPDTSEFKHFVDEVYRDFDLPSISVGLVKDGEVILTCGAGKKSKTDFDAPDGNTLYAIASLSKAFTATAVAMLVEDGELNWDDRVVDHLPWFKLNDDSVTNVITIEDLLCHRSGLETFDGDLLWYGTSYSTKEAVERLKHRELSQSFRGPFGYQNLMFMTAGLVIEKASGTSWNEFVQTRILDPLEMTRTTSSFKTFFADANIAKPFINGDQIFMMSYDNSQATAALNSCVNDLAKWLSFWLSDGIVDGDTMLTRTSLDRIWEIHTELSTGSFDETNEISNKGYGLGWFLMDYKGKKVAHHGGGLPGYITKVAVSKEDGFGIIALTNDMSSASSMLMYAGLDWLHEEDYKKWSATFLEFKTKGEERSKKAKDERLETLVNDPKLLPLSDYHGVYEDKMYGQAEVIEHDGKMMLILNPAKELFSGPLSPWAEHAFKFDHNDPFLTYGIVNFIVEKDVIKGFTIDLPNDDFHFHKLNFAKKQ